MSARSAEDATPAQTAVRRRALLGQLGPLRAFLGTESASAGLLLAATAIALLWANSPLSDSYTQLWHTPLSIRVGGAELAMDLEHWVNDGLMALFFFVIGLEVRRELSIGELTHRRRVVVPLVAGLAGMLLPALLYLALNPSGEAAGAGASSSGPTPPSCWAPSPWSARRARPSCASSCSPSR